MCLCLFLGKVGEIKTEQSGPVKTSILDLPLIDILVPRELKKSDKKTKKQQQKQESSSEKEQKKEMKKAEKSKKKSKGSDKQRPESAPTTATGAVVKTATSSAGDRTTVAVTTTREVDSSLFRGLDPERISTELSDKYKNMVVKGTSAELNQPEVEVFIEKTTALVEAPIKAVVTEEAKKEQERPVTVIDFPTIIDIERPREVILVIFLYFKI